MKTPPGTLLELTAADYHGDLIDDTPCLSASLIKVLLAATPKHAWTHHPKLNPDHVRDEEQRFDFGSCVHAMFLEGREAFDICDFKDWKSNAAKEARDAARDAGRIPLLAKQADHVEEMCGAVRNQTNAYDIHPPLFADGKAEQTIVWQENGVQCKALIDWLHNDHSTIDDLKTATRSAHPETWGRTMFGFQGEIQAVFHARAVKALTGREPLFRFVVAETFAPYLISVVDLAPSAIELANAKVDHALEVWRRCLAMDEWPGYPARVASIAAPPWAEMQWLEREEFAA
jgi:hypothetical protein